MVLKQFSSIYMLHTRFGGVWNCRVLKHQKIKEPLFCKEAKLHGAQALQPLKITNVQVWKKIKLQGSQTCYCAAKTKKLQGTQTFTGWSLRQQRVWQKIKLHDSQTFSLLFPLWRRAKLHGTQTEDPQDFSILKAWRKVKLHGTQTRAATDPLVLEKKKLHGTQIRNGKQL